MTESDPPPPDDVNLHYSTEDGWMGMANASKILADPHYHKLWARVPFPLLDGVSYDVVKLAVDYLEEKLPSPDADALEDAGRRIRVALESER